MSDVHAALSARRLTIKIGSSLLVDEDGRVRREWLFALARDIAERLRSGQQILVVTSGAIALGRRSLGLPHRSLRLEEKQAAAAAGQIVLARAYQESLAEVGAEAAQLLITLGDTEARRRYLNARATIETLLRLGAVPVVNENDTVATNEIRFGDNDRLSARVAIMACSETLVLLSDVEGLHTADPALDPNARFVPVVEEIDDGIWAMAGGSRSAVGTGGMISKLTAARIATRSGSSVVLARGTAIRPLKRLVEGAPATLFVASGQPQRARKHWIAASLVEQGRMFVDSGAERALRTGSSLLPIGVRRLEGQFERGDAVLVLGPGGEPVAKGLSAYDAADAQRIIGRRTEEIEAVLGWRGRDELVHRDDLVLL